MSKQIQLELKKDLIMEAVKADTFQRAQADKAADPVKFASLAFNEAAGDETYHERKLLRLLRSGLAKFCAMLAEFVDSENGSITYDLSDSSNDIFVNVVVSDRYQEGLKNPMSSLAEDFVVFNMDSVWWQSFDSNLAKDYEMRAADALTYVRRCLSKTAPAASTSSYADVRGSVVGGNIVSIVFPESVYHATVGGTFSSPHPTTNPSGLALTYTSSNNSVATVNATTGNVTVVGAGTAVITASFAGNEDYRSGNGSYTLAVTNS